MLLKMNSIYCTEKAVCHSGELIDVPDAEAKQLVDGKFAVPHKGPARDSKGRALAVVKPGVTPAPDAGDE
jgi:hypothetical protein